MPNQPAKKPMTTGHARLTAVIFLIIVGGGIWLFTSSSSKPSNDVQSVAAYNACQGFVEEQLTSPGSADFPGVTSSDYPSITGSGDGPFDVSGHVDSENGFGAKLRSDYDCTTSDVAGSWTDGGTTVTQEP